jgi:hypothetical protein
MKNAFKLRRIYLLGILFVSIMIFTVCKKPGPRTLPIYRLSTPVVNENTVRQLATKLLKISGEVGRTEDRLVLQSDQQVVEMYLNSGGIWVADEAQLWNPDLKPTLLEGDSARIIGDAFLRENKLLPAPDEKQNFSIEFTKLGATYAALFDDNTQQRTDRKLDVQLIYSMKINVRHQGDSLMHLPVVGGGGEFNLSLGDQGSIIGYSGVWRQIEGVETESPVIPEEKANEEFKKMVAGMEIQSFESFLAYYSAPSTVEQKYLYPVYVYRAVATVDNETVPLRLITIPATEFGPKLELLPPPPKRTENDMPQRRSTMPEGPEEKQGQSEKTPGQNLTAQVAGFEAGTSWIGQSGGLSGSQKNTKGFIDGLSADGWNINFNWGDAAAWESDWRRNDDSWVDAADFVFYTGHANMNGWQLRNPDDGFLHFNEVGASPESPGDIWGQQDLEWVIIAACGPLQDEVISPGGGDVFSRWDGAFDGLHQLLGYGAVTYDNEEEGKTVVRYAREGKTIINAWFRAAREIQPSTNGWTAPDGPTIWVGVMYVYRSGTTSPGNDHIWGHGSVAPDPTSPNIKVAIWTTT